MLAKKDGIFCVPRGIAWIQKKDFGWLACVEIDKMSRQDKYRPKDIEVTHLEKKRSWYQDTLRFLEGPKEDLYSLLAKSERRFNLTEGGQEEMHFVVVEESISG